MTELEIKLKEAIWVAKTLYERGKATGSSANLSFMHDGEIYITGTGTCFGNLKSADFSVISSGGKQMGSCSPSKELPLHQALYQKDPGIQAVIHTHSFYSTLWSCLPHENEKDIIPSYTPYLKMKLGTVGLIPYAKPGTQKLFEMFEERLHDSAGYLLQNHGPVVGGLDMMSAFYILEELEESARIAWELRSTEANLIK
jgi:3-dehydro-4-phosphotetronate decarboxylase